MKKLLKITATALGSLMLTCHQFDAHGMKISEENIQKDKSQFDINDFEKECRSFIDQSINLKKVMLCYDGYSTKDVDNFFSKYLKDINDKLNELARVVAWAAYEVNYGTEDSKKLRNYYLNSINQCVQDFSKDDQSDESKKKIADRTMSLLTGFTVYQGLVNCAKLKGAYLSYDILETALKHVDADVNKRLTEENTDTSKVDILYAIIKEYSSLDGDLEKKLGDYLQHDWGFYIDHLGTISPFFIEDDSGNVVPLPEKYQEIDLNAFSKPPLQFIEPMDSSFTKALFFSRKDVKQLRGRGKHLYFNPLRVPMGQILRITGEEHYKEINASTIRPWLKFFEENVDEEKIKIGSVDHWLLKTSLFEKWLDKYKEPVEYAYNIQFQSPKNEGQEEKVYEQVYKEHQIPKLNFDSTNNLNNEYINNSNIPHPQQSPVQQYNQNQINFYDDEEYPLPNLDSSNKPSTGNSKQQYDNLDNLNNLKFNLLDDDVNSFNNNIFNEKESNQVNLNNTNNAKPKTQLFSNIFFSPLDTDDKTREPKNNADNKNNQTGVNLNENNTNPANKTFNTGNVNTGGNTSQWVPKQPTINFNIGNVDTKVSSNIGGNPPPPNLPFFKPVPVQTVEKKTSNDNGQDYQSMADLIGKVKLKKVEKVDNGENQEKKNVGPQNNRALMKEQLTARMAAMQNKKNNLNKNNAVYQNQNKDQNPNQQVNSFKPGTTSKKNNKQMKKEIDWTAHGSVNSINDALEAVLTNNNETVQAYIKNIVDDNIFSAFTNTQEKQQQFKYIVNSKEAIVKKCALMNKSDLYETMSKNPTKTNYPKNNKTDVNALLDFGLYENALEKSDAHVKRRCREQLYYMLEYLDSNGKIKILKKENKDNKFVLNNNKYSVEYVTFKDALSKNLVPVFVYTYLDNNFSIKGPKFIGFDLVDKSETDITTKIDFLQQDYHDKKKYNSTSINDTARTLLYAIMLTLKNRHFSTDYLGIQKPKK